MKAPLDGVILNVCPSSVHKKMRWFLKSLFDQSHAQW
jgi:hypothetical protein